MACTTVVTEYRKRRESDNAAYTVEVECMSHQEIEDLLQQSVTDYKRYHLLDLNSSERVENGEVEMLRKKAQLAWDTLKAVFENHDECSEDFFQNAGNPASALTQMVLGWKNELVWPEGFDTCVVLPTAEDVPNCVAQIESFVQVWIWPFVKVVR